MSFYPKHCVHVNTLAYRISAFSEILTMSMTFRLPKEKAMALGGVATGNMKASDAEMVQGSITYSGWILIAVAWIKKNGR